jgi:hypothetical protein
MEKYKPYAKSRRDARQGVKYILGKPEVFGNLTRQDLKDEAVLQDLAGRTYDKISYADAVRDVVYPQLRYFKPGYFYKKDIPLEACDVTESVCGNAIVSTHTEHLSGVGYQPKQALFKTAPINKEEYYTQFEPIMKTEYAIPANVTEEEIVEKDTQTIPAQTPVKRTRVRTGVSTTNKSANKPIVTQTSAPTQKITERKYRIIRDPNNNIISKTEIQKLGGRLNYFDYFKFN